MKKCIVTMLVLAMLLSLLAGCGTADTPVTTAPTTEATDPGSAVAKGTKWDAVAEFHREADESSVWQYFFFDPEDSSYNAMLKFLDHEDSDIHSWYPWEGSWVGVGFNIGEYCSIYGDALEQNADGPSGMISVIGFVAPADGEYLVTGKVMNTFDQNAGPYSVRHADGTVITEVEYRDYTKGGYTFLDPTKVTLKKGEIIYFQPSSLDGWVSAYTELAVYYEPEDESLLVKPESFIPEAEYPTISVDMSAAMYNARGEFNTESATDAPWVYAITSDGVTFDAQQVYIEREWDDDPEIDAMEWYMSEEDYVGIGINADVEHFLEANISDSFENGGSAAALGFKAPADGDYSFTVFTQNVFEQNADKIYVSLNGETVSEIPFNAYGNAKIVDVTLKAGETVYFYGVSNGGWVSAYLTVYVNAYSAVGQFNRESAENGNWVYAVTTDFATFTPALSFAEPDWTGDGEPDAAQWYSLADGQGTGIGMNVDMPGWIEANINDGTGETMALGFKAPADGTYALTVVTLNAWDQDGGDVAVSLNGSVVDSVPFVDLPFGKTVTVEMKAGETVYIYGTSNSGWISCYLQAAVNQVG